MTIRKMTPEDVSAETAQVAQLEAALQDAQTALDSCPNPAEFRYPPPASMRAASDAQRNGLVSAVAEAQRALDNARTVQSNNVIYAEIIAGTEANMAKNAAAKRRRKPSRRGKTKHSSSGKRKTLTVCMAVRRLNLQGHGRPCARNCLSKRHWKRSVKMPVATWLVNISRDATRRIPSNVRWV